MKGLKKLILASAITAASTSAFAMQALDDETLSATTGQDGLTITLSTDVTIGALRIHDKDGLSGVAGLPNGTFDPVAPTYGFSGYFDGGLTGTSTAGDTNAIGTTTKDASIVITGGAGGITIQDTDLATNGPTRLTIDTGAQAAGTDPVLHIGVAAQPLTIGLGGTVISVRAGDGSATPTAANNADILSFDVGTTLSLGGSTLNIDLGNQPTGHLIWGQSTLNEDATSGYVLELSNVNVLQGTTNGIGLSDIGIAAAGAATSITSNIQIGVNNSGLYITTSTVGGVGLDVSVGDIKLGTLATASSIGSVYIDNLRMGANTITVAGH